MFSWVEAIADDDEFEQAPCKHGNIVKGHACYCHADTDETPRKCPIWRNFGVEDLSHWKKGSWNDDNCPFFEKNQDFNWK